MTNDICISKLQKLHLDQKLTGMCCVGIERKEKLLDFSRPMKLDEISVHFNRDLDTVLKIKKEYSEKSYDGDNSISSNSTTFSTLKVYFVQIYNFVGPGGKQNSSQDDGS